MDALLEPLYLFPAIVLARSYREGFLHSAIIALTRSFYLAYRYLYSSYPIGPAGYFWGLVLLASTFSLFYFGPPKEARVVFLSFLTAYPSIFPPYVPLAFGAFLILLRPFLREPLMEPLAHALVSGLPVMLALSALNTLKYSILALILLLYWSFLLVPLDVDEFAITRTLIGLTISIATFLEFPTEGLYSIGAAMVRPSVIGSEAVWYAASTKRPEFLAISIASYALTLLTLYGEPVNVFVLGVLIFVASVIATAAFEELINE